MPIACESQPVKDRLQNHEKEIEKNMSDRSLIVKAINNPYQAFFKIKKTLNNELEDVIRFFFQRNTWSQTLNQKEIRVVGLRRTGNHALITWIKKQEKGEVRYINNVKTQENPYRYKYQNLLEYHPQHKWAIEKYKAQSRGILTPTDCLIYSYEDYGLDRIFNRKFERKHDLYLGKTQKRYDVLILRDPFNLMASRIKSNYLSVKDSSRNVIDLWIAYAKEYLGETQYLTHNKICINYNQWSKDIEYRKQIASQLDLEFSDSGIDSVKSWGGGSSFEGQELDGRASKMDVNNRWKTFASDASYQKWFKDPELLHYSEQIFGKIPGTELLG